MGDFADVAFFDRDLVAGRAVQIDGRKRCGDVERDAVAFGEDGDHIRADLIGDVAVCGDAVGADDDGVNAALFHDVAAHVVGDQRDGNVVLHQFPSGQPRTLQIRPRFVGDDGDDLALIDRSANHAESRSPNAARRESSGVAVRQDRRNYRRSARRRISRSDAAIRCLRRGSLSHRPLGSV